MPRIFLLLVAAIASVSLAAAGEASPSPPPTLAGETFLDFSPQTSVTCNADSGTITFSAAGVATGPYAGSFTETGTAAVVAQVRQPVLAFDASFSIDSPTGRVEGTKHEIAPASSDGFCANLGPFEGPTLPFADAAFFVPAIAYEATIHTAAGSFTDSGGSFVHLAGCEPVADPPFACPSKLLYEIFDSNQPSPIPVGPAAVTVEPAEAVNAVGTQHTVTATVFDASGAPLAGASVIFSVQGSVHADGPCTTGPDGTCSFTYSGPQLPGADSITACADSNHNGAVDSGEPCGTATKAWLLPSSTPGQVTGGGQVAGTAGADQVAFGFTARSTDAGISGECTVVDPFTKTKIKCLDVTALIQTATHATFFGNASSNGVATTYRIDVDDLGEPGAGSDTFQIETSSGYAVGGLLVHGNVQVHA
jgi:hypothetical protein